MTRKKTLTRAKKSFPKATPIFCRRSRGAKNPLPQFETEVNHGPDRGKPISLRFHSGYTPAWHES